MDNFKTLFEKKEYELVIKVTQNSSDVEDLFYCLSAFLALNKIDEALKFIDEKYNILKTRLPLLMKTHIELLCLKKDFDGAYQKIDYYKDLPYYSQEAEEVLKELPKIVREYEKAAYPKIPQDEENIIKGLLSKDTLTVLAAVSALEKLDINPYLLYLKKLLVDFPHQTVRSYVLIFLNSKHVDMKVKFLHIDKIIEINPNDIGFTYNPKEILELKQEMIDKFHDISLSENASELLNNYLIYIYPEEIDLHDPSLLEALKIVASKLLQIPCDDIPSESAKKYIEDIEKALNDL